MLHLREPSYASTLYGYLHHVLIMTQFAVLMSSAGFSLHVAAECISCHITVDMFLHSENTLALEKLWYFTVANVHTFLNGTRLGDIVTDHSGSFLFIT